MRPRLLVSLSLSDLTRRIIELFRESSTKKYHLNDLILYVEKKDFEVGGINIFQQGIATTPAVIGGHGGGEPKARALILRSRWEKRAEERKMTVVKIEMRIIREKFVRMKV